MTKEEYWNRGRESKLRRLMQSCTKRKTNAARKTEQIPDNSLVLGHLFSLDLVGPL